MNKILWKKTSFLTLNNGVPETGVDQIETLKKNTVINILHFEIFRKKIDLLIMGRV